MTSYKYQLLVGIFMPLKIRLKAVLLISAIMINFSAHAAVTQCSIPTPPMGADADGDGYDDTVIIGGAYDLFPSDATEWYDTDLNGVGNNADPDDDGDGVPDVSDNNRDGDSVIDIYDP
ncbi:MAG: hypothetical protein ACI9N3_002398, partial [Colwellia sp.]